MSSSARVVTILGMTWVVFLSAVIFLISVVVS